MHFIHISPWSNHLFSILVFIIVQSIKESLCLPILSKIEDSVKFVRFCFSITLTISG